VCYFKQQQPTLVGAFLHCKAERSRQRISTAKLVCVKGNMSKQLDVLGLGAVAVDDVIYVASYPPADSKARVLGRHRRFGGLTGVALISAARLGGSCAYAGVLGHDELSLFALNSLKAENIDVSSVKQTSLARPVHSNIVVDERRGTRNIFFDEAGVVGARSDVSARLITSSRVLFIDNLGVNGMIRAARLARKAGVPVVADLESSHEPAFHELLKLADHLIISRAFATKLTGKASARLSVCSLAASGHEISVVTCGADGCWYMVRGWKAPKHHKAFKVNAVDTTGCGDVFHGAYAFGLARNMSLEERVRLASGTAALKASGAAGLAGIPSYEKVRRFLKDEQNSQTH